MTEYMFVGTVLKPQGIRGEAKVKSYASNLEDFLHWKTLYVQEGKTYTPMKARCARVHDGFAYVTLEGCTRPEDVEKLRDCRLYIDRAHAAPLTEGEVYICDLIGCTVESEDGQEIGTVTDVLQHGTVDVYVIRTSKGVMMVPALKTVFPTLDVEHKRVLVNTERLAEVAVLED